MTFIKHDDNTIIVTTIVEKFESKEYLMERMEICINLIAQYTTEKKEIEDKLNLLN